MTTTDQTKNERINELFRLGHNVPDLPKYVGICGQAPSDFPVITRWLVEQGIDSISLNPDRIIEMTRVVLEMEKELGL